MYQIIEYAESHGWDRQHITHNPGNLNDLWYWWKVEFVSLHAATENAHRHFNASLRMSKLQCVLAGGQILLSNRCHSGVKHVFDDEGS